MEKACNMIFVTLNIRKLTWKLTGGFFVELSTLLSPLEAQVHCG